jgi:hypothetical protein
VLHVAHWNKCNSQACRYDGQIYFRWYKILGLFYKRALFDLQFVHNLFWLKLKWNARSKLFYCIIYRSSIWSSIYRSFSIAGNYGRQSFSKYGISYYDAYDGWCNHSRLNRHIWYRHPNSEAGNDEIQNVQSKSKHGFLFCDKVVATFEKHIFLSQTDLTRTGIISNSYNEMFEA